MVKILIVEDERPISDLIKMNLSDAGYLCATAYDGLAAADLLEEQSFDLVLLDIMLPKVDGYELFEYIKPMKIPVIFLTAKGSLEDRVKGLNLGSEDYIVKPFEIVELLARVQVVLRRFHKTDETLSFADITINTEIRQAKKGDQPLELTPKEYELLTLFFRNVGTTLFREHIYEAVWEKEYMEETRTLDLHMQRLRKKTGLDKQLKTIYGIGYRLEE